LSCVLTNHMRRTNPKTGVVTISERKIQEKLAGAGKNLRDRPFVNKKQREMRGVGGGN